MGKQALDQDYTGDYCLDVRDFGPIGEASVDLRPFTVFIGPSNTGKSYLAILVYSLHKCFSSLDYAYETQSPLHVSSRIAPTELGSFPPGPAARRRLRDWFFEGSEKNQLPALPPEVVSYVRSALMRTQSLGRDLSNEIPRYYGIDTLDKLVRRDTFGKMVGRDQSDAPSSVRLIVPQNSSEAVRYDLRFGRDNVQFSANVPSIESVEFLGNVNERNRFLDQFIMHKGGANRRSMEHLLQTLTQIQFRYLLKPLYRDAYYLPADRAGVMHSHKMAVSTFLLNATKAALHPPPETPMLSKVFADFLTQLINIPDHARDKTTLAVASQLEEHILKGSVGLDRTVTDYPIFTYHPQHWGENLPLMRTSSMVSELAPVVLYLRHVVRPNDLLIVEEPESHLHPSIQAAFARELVRLVRANVRVVITTHSEWFLEQIGNLVRLSALPEERRHELKNEDLTLRPEEVGVWLFKPPKGLKGSMVKEITLDDETGLYSTGFEEVSETLYNEGADIFNRIQDGNN